MPMPPVARIAADCPDLVLLDVVMPGLSGYDVCRQLRADPATATLPVVMVTALDPAGERIKGLEAGADDFLGKPINQAELIVDGCGDDPLASHRREVTVVFLDLRGFTAFAETAEPEDVMAVLHSYHAAMGRLIQRHGGTLERFTGDGLMVFFNDPVVVPDATARAVRMALAMRDTADVLGRDWQRRGIELGLAIGIAEGYATIGAIGFEDRIDYGAIGTVTNLAARLCGEAASGQILTHRRTLARVETLVACEEVGELALKGFSRPVAAVNLLALPPQARDG
ncbi:MAG TPA: adenylate/guanylate cyclase domain-containing protein [Rhodocyclaceae bacterium]|nr:adenylate/guanylate cyclase domain-containing protein [Rhodocyclaceae bacterium]